MHGYTVDQLIGRNLSIFHNEDQMKRVEKLNKQLDQTGSFVAEEVWHTRKDKTSFPALMSAVVIKDEDDKPIFLSATAIDITDLHQVKEEIIKTKDYSDNIIESSLDAIVITDSKFYFAYQFTFTFL